MNSETLVSRVKIIIAEILGIKDIPAEAMQNDYVEWDSLAYLSVIAQLETEFGIEISEKNINNFDSVPSIVREIEECL